MIVIGGWERRGEEMGSCAYACVAEFAVWAGLAWVCVIIILVVIVMLRGQAGKLHFFRWMQANF